MTFRDTFPTVAWFGRQLKSKAVPLTFLAFVVLLLAMGTVARLYTFFCVRKMHAVISALSKLEIDKTSKDEVVRTVPYLVRSPYEGRTKKTAETGDVDEGLEQVYYVAFANEDSWMRFIRFVDPFARPQVFKDGRESSWAYTVAGLLGYRYFNFGASVQLLDGRVSQITYYVADRLVFPRVIGDIVSARSFHGSWAPRQSQLAISSIDDENPQLHVRGNDIGIGVEYAFDAPSETKAHVFQVNLNCFWSLLGCRHPRQLVPLLWQDKLAIEAAALARLKSSDPCPDRILAGRVRYLPDAGMLLLESTGFKVQSVSEEGERVDEEWTNYKLIEVLRGRASQSWEAVRGRVTIPYPGDYNQRIYNMGPQGAEAGKRVLAFTNDRFDSCRLILATPSALSTVRNTILAPRRDEDQAVFGLQ